MKVAIGKIDKPKIKALISPSIHGILTEQEEETMNKCIMLSETLWIGTVDGELACMWGVVPPTLMSSQAYLWLHTTPLVQEHQFAFVRHSQRAIEELLKEYELILGDCLVGADQSIRWLKWLGAQFLDPVGMKIPFFIKKKK